MTKNHTPYRSRVLTVCLLMAALLTTGTALKAGETETNALHTYNLGHLKPVDSKLKVRVGEPAPLFTLRDVKGGKISLRQFRGKKNVVLSFVPAAFTPVCSARWPGYNLVMDMFKKRDTILLGISTDNIPSLYAWNQEMGGMKFPILSDFYPHGAIAARYGILRHDGMAEQALFVIDKRGIIRYIDVHNINTRPPLENLIHALDKLHD